ncbi:hypothetical protein Bca4012_101793 [Brassica carinata]
MEERGRLDYHALTFGVTGTRVHHASHHRSSASRTISAKPPSTLKGHDAETKAGEAELRKPPPPRNKSQPSTVGGERENAGDKIRSVEPKSEN